MSVPGNGMMYVVRQWPMKTCRHTEPQTKSVRFHSRSESGVAVPQQRIIRDSGQKRRCAIVCQASESSPQTLIKDREWQVYWPHNRSLPHHTYNIPCACSGLSIPILLFERALLGNHMPQCIDRRFADNHHGIAIQNSVRTPPPPHISHYSSSEE